MKKIFSLLALLFLFSFPALATSVSGNLTTILGSASTNSFVRFRLRNYSGAQPKVNGTTVIAGQKIQADVTPDVNGNITTSLYDNDLITPAGTYYTIEIWSNGSVVSANDYLVYGDNFNLNAATPLATTPIPASTLVGARSFLFQQTTPATVWTIVHGFGQQAVIIQCQESGVFMNPVSIVATDVNTVVVTFPTANTGSCLVLDGANVAPTTSLANAIVSNPTSNQLILGTYNLSLGGNFLPLADNTQSLGSPTARWVIPSGLFTGNPTFNGNPVFSGAPSFTGSPTFTLNPAFSGNPSFSGNPAFTGLPTFQTIENTFYIDQYAGADAGAKANTVIALMPAAGGKLSFCGLTGSIAAAATITLSKPVIVEFCGTNLTVSGNPGFNVTASGVKFSGVQNQSTITQGVAGNNVIQGTVPLTDLEVSGINFVGTCAPNPAGCTPASNNNAVFLQSNTQGNILRVNIHDNVFLNFLHAPVILYNVDDAYVRHNTFTTDAQGVRFGGVRRGWIIDNDFNSTNAEPTANTTFTVGVVLESTNAIGGISYPPPDMVHIDRNTFANWVDAQAILVHAGTNVEINGNIMQNVLYGIALGTFQAGDNLSTVSVSNNTYKGTITTGAAGATGNYGISVLGGAGFLVSHVSITGNTLQLANQISTNVGGAIGVTYADDVAITGNVLQNTAGAPIVLSTNATRVSVRANEITNATGSNGYGVYLTATGTSGMMEGNSVDTMVGAVRSDSANLGFVVGNNTATGLTGLKITNPANMTIAGGTEFFGTATLSGGTFTVTFPTSVPYTVVPICTATDQTAANAVKVAPTLTQLVLTGTTTDVIAWDCKGN